MKYITDRLAYLFRSTTGLVLLAISLIAVIAGVWGMISFGYKDEVVAILGLDMVAAEREGRAVILWHCFAMAVMAILVYYATASLPMKKNQQAIINAIITAGYMITMLFGMLFAYFGHNWAFHGLYIFGLSLIFLAGVLLVIALFPWLKQYKDNHGKIDMERMAFFVVGITTLISAIFGAVPGSFFGNGFEVFLAEDTIREPGKSALDLSVIGHLHIMLALMGIFLTLLVGRWLKWKGKLHTVAMPTMMVGALVLSLGVWMVVPFESIAHVIIWVGCVPFLLSALFLVIWGFRKLIQDRIAAQGIKKPHLGHKLLALIHDPLKFGQLWQMVYMNFVVTFVGLFMAAKLEEIMRWWPARDESIILTAHWHILSTIIATIILLHFADRSGLKGIVRQVFGWLVIIGSNIAFAAVVIFSLKRVFVSEYAQQPFVDTVQIPIEIGIVALWAALGALLVWRWIDLLFKKEGRWKKEKAEELDSQEVSE
jgi:hypothetical protein